MKLLEPVLLLTLLGCPTPDETGDSTPVGDTDTDTDTVPVDVEVVDLSWRLHDDVGSLVYVSWEQSAAGTVHVVFGGDEDGWSVSPPWEATAGTHEQLLLGIPFDASGYWQVVVEGGESFAGEAYTTGPKPESLPVPALGISLPERQLEIGNYLLASINGTDGGWTAGNHWTFIVDRAGRLVWASLAPEYHWTLFAQVSVTGDYILWDEATYWTDWFSDGSDSTVHRTYLDAEIDEIATPGLHHAFVQLPDGTLVWGSKYHAASEALVEKALGSEVETVLWTCDDDWSGAGHCESNGLFYAADRDAFLYSFYTNDSIVEVDHATGGSTWWAGEVGGGYAFDPPESQFSWQHGISYTDTGSLLVSTHASNDSGSTTMLREYTVDHDAQTLTEIWSYDPDIYASTNGDAWRLDNGNTLHLLGSASTIIEVAADGEVVWQLDYGGSKLLGRGEFIEDLYALVPDQGRQPETEETP